MLVLSRKEDESIIIGGNTRVTVLSIQSNRVRIGIECDNSVPIVREELLSEPPHNGYGNTSLKGVTLQDKRVVRTTAIHVTTKPQVTG